MSDVAIQVDSLSKRYRLGETRGHNMLRERLAHLASAPLRWARGQNGNGAAVADAREFWALRDVSFEVKTGEVLGVIGRNGAGKSTLLKILSRITEPTSGTIDIFGRVASLLEVGTGFHPELTGRENIYLNGSILGMSKKEIDRKFDEIVDFSGIEKFIDTPVKRYSSGMGVRLGFAVAAHLEPEILIVDEVLAVGDAEFQKKCLGKMSAVASSGRTVLFVSHNLGQVGRLCGRAIVLDGGRMCCDAQIDEALGHYNQIVTSAGQALVNDAVEAHVVITDEAGEPLRVWHYGEAMIVDVEFKSRQPLVRPAVDITFYSDRGVRVLGVRTDRLEDVSRPSALRHRKRIRITNTGIVCGDLTVDMGIRCNNESAYIGVWERVTSIVVSTARLPSQPSPETIVALPAEMLEASP